LKSFIVDIGVPTPIVRQRRAATEALSADALALPGFTFGLDIVILVGHLRLSKHLTLDEVHHFLQEQLTLQQATISRREILYLFEAYCSLLRAASQPSEDPEFQQWRAKVEANGGLIISIDGIQPRLAEMKHSIWCAMF
jgi:hypothetical protein